MTVARQHPGARSFLGWVVACLGGVICFVMVSEWWTIVMVGDGRTIAEYHFGSECMMAHGGWSYASAELYGWWSLISGAAVLTLSIILRSALVRRSWARLIIVVLVSIASGGSFW